MPEDAEELRREEVGSGEMDEAEIDRNVAGSFPASDPPSWTLGIEHPHKPPGAKVEPSADAPAHPDEKDPSA